MYKSDNNIDDARVLLCQRWLVGVEFNAPLISEAVFAANYLTDTDKQNSTGKYRQTKSIQIRKSKQPKIQQNTTTLVQLPLTTLGQETRWAYSTTLPSPHGACVSDWTVNIMVANKSLTTGQCELGSTPGRTML